MSFDSKLSSKARRFTPIDGVTKTRGKYSSIPVFTRPFSILNSATMLLNIACGFVIFCIFLAYSGTLIGDTLGKGWLAPRFELNNILVINKNVIE